MAATRTAQQNRDVRRERMHARAARDTSSPRYKWIVLSNTTLGVLIASVDE